MAKTLDAAGVKRLIQEIKGANKNLNAPIPISTENTTESMAQNVKNIADYVAKAKAAGIANVNGMAVTCLIDSENSGVGYLYVTNTQVLICGILAYEDNSVSRISVIDGTYGESSIVVEGHIGQVTSDMLVEGARKPIILTPSTTEVDEETYQKLLSDDVDVIFKTSIDDANLCTLTYKVDDGNFWSLYFTCFSIEGEALGNIYFYAYEVAIEKNAPHTCTINVLKRAQTLDDAIESYDYIKKAILSPVLQEIDLTGTDADRKAKLDQFETDWKALTGADDLTGARFVGKFGITDDVERNVTGIMTYSAGDDATEKNDDCFYGICNGYSFSKQKSQIAVKVSCKNGSLTITPLFSHLEAVTIRIGNTPEDKAANVAAIKAYVDNLISLGVDITKGYMIPFYKYNTNAYGVLIGNSTTPRLQGYLNGDNTAYAYVVGKDGTVSEALIQLRVDVDLTTTSKKIVGAINEVNALAKSKQDTLTSGTNIKTVNGQSLLGSGDIEISGGGDVTAAGDNTFTGNNVFSGIAIADILDGTQYQITGDNGVLMFTSGATNEDVQLSGVATPTYSNSAANKSYVDTQINTALGTVLTQLQNI